MREGSDVCKQGISGPVRDSPAPFVIVKLNLSFYPVL